MMQNQFVLIFIGLLIFSTLSSGCNKQLQVIESNDKAELSMLDDASRPQPNVVLLLADDLGWQDVKCYDIDEPAPYETPHIDRLAKEGTMFWQAYSPAPTCAPSRCAIMSGNHPARAQKTHVVGGAPPKPHSNSSRMMSPWYSGRMPADEMTLAKALKTNNYTTGHSGKWHMAISHNAFPQPADVGFDYTRSDRGVANAIRPDVMSDFSTDDPDEEYPIDKNGFIVNPTTQDALNFLKEAKDKPFFLYYAEWLVHGPIQTRNRRLLDKYSAKLDVEVPNDPKYAPGMTGQHNPFYCSMVEEFDNYVGQVVHYLKTTDDPRWPGHKLYENTYFIFTSDNGGMEKGHQGQTTTDNYPLDRGKISAMEGGTRVPFIVTGPGIKAGLKSDVMVNGLDFYPTILALTGTKTPAGKNLDGCDLSDLLLKDATNPKLVKDQNGKERTMMMWHFPNSVALESTIRNSDYKLIRNYDHIGNAETVPLELYRLYNSESGKSVRVDIEESKNVADELPELTRELNEELTEQLTEMKASYPYYNPTYRKELPNKETVPTVTSNSIDGNKVTFVYKENGAKVVTANLLYTLNGGKRYEEWFRAPAELSGGNTAEVILPKGTTHYFINLIDENSFLVSYPEIKNRKKTKKNKGKYSIDALIAIK